MAPPSGVVGVSYLCITTVAELFENFALQAAVPSLPPTPVPDANEDSYSVVAADQVSL
jgi:hypothetical protein